MKKKRLHQIDRRSFLKGMGGAVVALPLFDFFLDSHGVAYAQTASGLPKRYLLMANGISLTKAGNYTNFLLPARVGAAYDLRNGMIPIGTFPNLQPYVSVLTNLRLPSVIASSTSSAPAGGFKGDFHAAANRAQLTGRQSDASTAAAFTNPLLTSMGASSDQILRSILNASGTHVHMNYSVQPKVYIYTGSSGRAITQFNQEGKGLQPQSSPAAAFDELFFNQKSPDPAVEAQRLLAVEQRKSVLDLIDKGLVNYLKRELGTSERTLLANHFEQIRDLEIRVNTDASSQPVSSACVKPTRPVDPPLGPNYQNGTTIDGEADANLAYSNENLRADIFIDLIHMAMACDIARHGTLRLTYSQSWMNSNAISGMAMDYHELSHTGNTAQIPFLKMVQWHVSKFAKLADKLRNTREGSGNLLDNCALIMTSEGGGGISSDTGVGNSPHCGDNMATLVAGRAGGMTTGTHIATNQVHPSRVLLTAMQAVGYTGNTLGQVSGKIPELLP